MSNYSFTRGGLPIVNNGDTFERCNFSQLLPNTPIFTGITGLTFINCNLINCSLPGDAVIESCNQSQVDRCTNINPQWIDHGQTACIVNCRHVKEIDTVVIDGVTIDTVYHYEDSIL
jgi:hypothetical protein